MQNLVFPSRHHRIVRNWLPFTQANQDHRQIPGSYATALYDYIHRAMRSTRLSLLPGRRLGYHLAAIPESVIAEDALIDAETLPKVQMPNWNGFIPDPGLDVG
jgi:hypothetical protein